jgi:hypothetical protein
MEAGSLTAGERKMHTFFRIIDTRTTLMSKPAPLNGRELARLRVTLQSAGIHADLDEDENDGTARDFEYNANAVPIARFAGLFERRLDIIEVLEEAQFLGRAIRVTGRSEEHFATLMVSEHIALSPEIAVSDDQANKVFECLGLDRTKDHSIPFTKLHTLLRHPAAYHDFDRRGLGYIFTYLARLSDTDCGDQSPELAWV